MSTNNQLIILRKDGMFEIHEDPCVDNIFKPSKQTLLNKRKTLKEAIKFANKYIKREMVEYGIAFDENCFKDSLKEDSSDGRN